MKRQRMRKQIRARQTNGQRRSRVVFGLTIKDILSLIASLILPLVLGLFTITTTNNQQNEVIRQSERDSFQRRQEWQMESNQSDRQWNVANKQNELQRELALEKYRDEVLVTYTTQIGELLEKGNGSLTSSPIIATIARVKTLNIIRQLDPLRSSNAIRFL